MTYSGKIKEEISKVESEKIESISELASYLENKGQENVNNNSWTSTLV